MSYSREDKRERMVGLCRTMGLVAEQSLVGERRWTVSERGMPRVLATDLTTYQAWLWVEGYYAGRRADSRKPVVRRQVATSS